MEVSVIVFDPFKVELQGYIAGDFVLGIVENHIRLWNGVDWQGLAISQYRVNCTAIFCIAVKTICDH